MINECVNGGKLLVMIATSRPAIKAVQGQRAQGEVREREREGEENA